MDENALPCPFQIQQPSTPAITQPRKKRIVENRVSEAVQSKGNILTQTINNTQITEGSATHNPTHALLEQQMRFQQLMMEQQMKFQQMMFDSMNK